MEDDEDQGRALRYVVSGLCTTGCSSVWLERLLREQEVAGSSPVTPTRLTAK